MNVPSIVFIGLGYNQLDYIQAAKNCGFHIIGFDSNINATSRNLCDDSFKIKIDDHKEIIRVLKKYNNLKGCVSEQTDNGLLSVGRINSYFNLNGPSFKQMKSIKDKSLQRLQSKTLNISQPDFITYNSENFFHNKANKIFINKYKKLIIKPFEGQSSIGVISISRNELLNCKSDILFNNLSKISGCKNFLIEEFVFGDDISIEGFVYQSKVYILAVCIKTKFEVNPMVDRILKVFPYEKKKHRLERELAVKIVNGFKLNYSFFHIEAKKNSNSLSLIEWSPRGCGSRLSSILLSKLYKLDVPMIRIGMLMKNYRVPTFKNHKNVGLLQFFNYDVFNFDLLHSNISKYTNEYILQINQKNGFKKNLKDALIDGRDRHWNIIAIAKTNKINCLSNYLSENKA
jgi:hypothetical protein